MNETEASLTSNGFRIDPKKQNKTKKISLWPTEACSETTRFGLAVCCAFYFIHSNISELHRLQKQQQQKERRKECHESSPTRAHVHILRPTGKWSNAKHIWDVSEPYMGSAPVCLTVSPSSQAFSVHHIHSAKASESNQVNHSNSKLYNIHCSFCWLYTWHYIQTFPIHMSTAVPTHCAYLNALLRSLIKPIQNPSVRSSWPSLCY